MYEVSSKSIIGFSLRRRIPEVGDVRIIILHVHVTYSVENKTIAT